MSLNEEDLIKARPLLFESRPFSRLTKRNTTLQSPSSAPITNHHAEINLDFSYFTSALTRIQLLLNTNAREISRYATEKNTITARASEARSTLIELRTLLEQSQNEKINRLEYDKIASDILSIKALRARDEQQTNIDRLNAEIKELERERDEYSQVWAARRGQFEEIVKQLEVMSAQIKEDKDEQDRREGMSEEEEEGEEGEVAGGKSGGATPAHTGEGLMVPVATRGVTPNVGSGATPQPVSDEKEEGEEEEEEGEDVDIVDAPPLRGKTVEKGGDRMDMS
ncbi:Tho complex subunit 7-domain-containing protein [Trichophaea hybrida]|nr:Tho complex subunit 7-domain-containing protein [Trichophaea hybrida]